MKERAAKFEEDEEIELQRRSDFEKKNHIIQTTTLPQFGSVSVVENPLVWERPVYLKTYAFDHRKEMKQQLAWAAKRKAIDSKHLNTYHEYTADWHSGFCASSGWVRHFFEIPTLLLTQFVEANSEQVYSNNIFLTELLYQICTAGSELEAKGLFHGNLVADYIRVQENCSFQLVDNFGSLGSLDGCANDIGLGLSKHSSPELMEAVFQKSSLSKIEASKHDVFCFGLLLLSLGLNSPLTDLYRVDGRLNRVVLASFLKQLNEKYESNSLFGTTVSAMLEAKVAFRPDFRSLIAKLPPHSEVRRHLCRDYQLPADLSLAYADIASLQPVRRTHNKLLQEQSLDGSRENTSMYYGRLHGPEDVDRMQHSLSQLVQSKNYKLQKAEEEGQKQFGINDSPFVRELKHSFFEKSKQKMKDQLDQGTPLGSDLNEGLFNILAGLNLKESEVVTQTDFRAPQQPVQSILSKHPRVADANPKEAKKNVQFQPADVPANPSALLQQLNIGQLFAAQTTKAAQTHPTQSPETHLPTSIHQQRPQAVYTGMPLQTAQGSQYSSLQQPTVQIRREYGQLTQATVPQQGAYSYYSGQVAQQRR